jgi:hypothetical protein
VAGLFLFILGKGPCPNSSKFVSSDIKNLISIGIFFLKIGKKRTIFAIWNGSGNLTRVDTAKKHAVEKVNLS